MAVREKSRGGERIQKRVCPRSRGGEFLNESRVDNVAETRGGQALDEVT